MTRAQKWSLGTLVSLAVLAACGKGGVSLYERWKDQQRQEALATAREALKTSPDAFPIVDSLMDPSSVPEETEPEAENEMGEMDDAALRQLAMQAELGERSPEFSQNLLRLARQEQQRWSRFSLLTPTGTALWTNLGPMAARRQYNGTYYQATDAGRVNDIAVDPRNARAVYIATSGGGIWFAPDFGQYPTWQPITDGLGSLAIGAIALDVTGVAPTAPPVIWAGLGDFFDQKVGAIVKSTDNGLSWAPPIALTGTHPADGLPTFASSVRDIAVDPTNNAHILVAADDALYRSTNGGATFTVVDLPNGPAGTRREATWSIAYLGSIPGQSHWLVSGLYACPGAGVPPPGPGLAAAACGANPGNLGDIWKSTDSGATWTSIRAAGGLPAVVTGATTTDISRIVLTASQSPTPATTVIYGLGGSLSEAASATNAIIKSVDGGSTWTRVASNTTALRNPTVLVTDCDTTNIGKDQSYYDLAIAVDPANPNHVLIGGSLCSARTRDGGATWEATSNWLPQSGRGYTSNNAFLGYVHADWHTALISRVGGTLLALVGCDGGLHSSSDVFSQDIPELINWRQPDIGLATHLFYSHGSGDPVFGDGDITFGGLQDNGTRYRLIEDEFFIFDWNLQNWDQISGGDGIGAAVVHNGKGENPVYWISVQGQWKYCRPRFQECANATRIENGTEIANWRRITWDLASIGDGAPFFVRYHPVNDANSAVVTASAFNVWKLFFQSHELDLPFVQRLTPNGINVRGVRQIRGVGPTPSPYTYTVAGKPSRIYGLPLTGGANGILIEPLDGTATTIVGSAATIVDSGVAISFMSSVAVPKDPAILGGTDITQTWLAASVQPNSPHYLFKTTNAGATWTPFHGDGTSDLPLAPIFTVKFDPIDQNTLYAATEFGLYRSTDAGLTWARFGVGLPFVRTWDLTINSNSSMIRVSTYGRGIWEIHPTEEAVPAPSNGDWDRNGVVDFFDIAPQAIRVGSAPQVGATPRTLSPVNKPYDHLLDVGGTPSTIGEDDIAALLTKFGSTP